MASTRAPEHVSTIIERVGGSYAREAGIRLKDTPSPLYQLLVLSVLLSARISSGVAVAAAKELFTAGMRTPRAMTDASWQERVDALGRGHYRRYDERTSTMLGNGAALVLDRWRGDLRRLHESADGDVERLRAGLQAVPGLGPLGSAIYVREVQGVWPDMAPFADERVQDGARRLDLPTDPGELAGLVPASRLPDLVGACVRVSRSPKLREALRD